MENNVAADLITSLVGLDKQINKIMDLIEHIVNPDEKHRFRREIASLTGTIYTNLMVPILREYPELDPDD